jgi:hypothetical protein
MGGAQVVQQFGFLVLWFLVGSICLLSAWWFRKIDKAGRLLQKQPSI